MEALDDVRKFLLEQSKAAGGKGALAKWSRALGKSDSYLHQFITRGSPRQLAEDDRHELAGIIGVDQTLLKPGALVPKIELPARQKVHFYVKEWRKFCEAKPAVLAEVLKIDADMFSFLETKSYRFTIEQLETIAAALKIHFDSMRWDPPPATIN